MPTTNIRYHHQLAGGTMSTLEKSSEPTMGMGSNDELRASDELTRNPSTSELQDSSRYHPYNTSGDPNNPARYDDEFPLY